MITLTMAVEYETLPTAGEIEELLDKAREYGGVKYAYLDGVPSRYIIEGETKIPPADAAPAEPWPGKIRTPKGRRSR